MDSAAIFETVGIVLAVAGILIAGTCLGAYVGLVIHFYRTL